MIVYVLVRTYIYVLRIKYNETLCLHDLSAPKSELPDTLPGSLLNLQSGI